MSGHHDELEVFRSTLERYHLFYVPSGYGDDYAICELLVDALGFCEEQGLDFDRILRIARGWFEDRMAA